jgi:hypothetical protein
MEVMAFIRVKSLACPDIRGYLPLTFPHFRPLQKSTKS